MTMKVEDLLVLLGKSSTNEKVRETLTALGIDMKKVRLKKGDFDVNVVAESYGIEIEFADPGKYKSTEPIPEGALVLGAVFISSTTISKLGSLPYGLEFGLTRELAASKLGKPVWSSPVAPIDRWLLDDHEVTIRFERTSLKVQRIIFSRPKQGA
ncbi:MAG: hypothetical protein QM750_12370 [Rubrivivax sp.]